MVVGGDGGMRGVAVLVGGFDETERIKRNIQHGLLTEHIID